MNGGKLGDTHHIPIYDHSLSCLRIDASIKNYRVKLKDIHSVIRV